MWSPLLRPSALVRVLLSRGTTTLQCQVRISMTASLDGFVIKSCLSTPLVGITREYPLRPSSASGGHLHHPGPHLPGPSLALPAAPKVQGFSQRYQHRTGSLIEPLSLLVLWAA